VPSAPGEDDIKYRPAEADDVPFLATMLGEAAVWRPDKPTPTAGEVMADPRYAMYLVGWPRQGDYGLVAEQDGPLGAAWYRTYTETSHGYGFVAENVPEVSIAVISSRRQEGIGRRLMVGLVETSVAQGYPALSLSMNDDNPARDLYESVGFEPVEHHGLSWTMIRHAAPSS
jgi:ribosomal protein S18 acetylase RimI-like enzyme